MNDGIGEIEKTKWVIVAPKFGKRRVWRDGLGFFYVVHNTVYRNYQGDDLEVYEAERVTDIYDDNVHVLSAFRDAALIADPLSQELIKKAASEEKVNV